MAVAARRLVVAALLLASFPAPALALNPLSASFPGGVPDWGTLNGWEHITGEVETRDDALVYEFFVNPARSGIYEVTRYRFTRGGLQLSEKFVWHARPGVERPRCYERLASGQWRQLQEQTAEYRGEMEMLMRVYGLHRTLRERQGRTGEIAP